MWYPGIVNSIIKIGVLAPHLYFLPATKHWWINFVFALILLTLLHIPNTGWAEENYFQIINDLSTPVNSGFTRDRGYAVFVSYEGKKFLMDTGVSENSLSKNMNAAGITLQDLDFVFLSHKHFDHKGGLGFIRRERPSLPIYIPPGGGFSNPEKLIEVNDYLKVGPNVFLIHTHNSISGVTDELSLLIKTNKGPYVFNACSHTGITKILEKSKRVAGQDIYFHSGGTQLNRAINKLTIQETVNKIKAQRVSQVSPSHCSTADRVREIYKEIFNTNYIGSQLGQKISLESNTN